MGDALGGLATHTHSPIQGLLPPPAPANLVLSPLDRGGTAPPPSSRAASILTLWSEVMVATHPGSTTIVEMESMRMVGPGT